MGSIIKHDGKKRIYFFYKTTNNINGHFYYGVHSTVKPLEQDTYLGSGRLLLDAIQRYGIENFSREILKFFNSMEDALAYEASVVTSEIVSRKDCYNMALGGYGSSGGSVYLNKDGKRIRTVPEKVDMFVENGWKIGGLPRSEEFCRMMSKVQRGKVTSEETKRKIAEAHRGRPGTRLGMKASEETKKKIGQVSKDTCYVHDVNGRNRRIKKVDLESYLTSGWIRGRNTEYRQKMSNVTKGRVWVSKDQINSRVPLESLEKYISLGWKKGKSNV